MDFQSIRGEYPIKQKMIYLNNASIAPLSSRVAASVNRFLEDVRDNGDTSYPDWCQHADSVTKDRIGKLIGADKSEIAFVKNTTEGILIVANGLQWNPGDNVVIADIERTFRTSRTRYRATPSVRASEEPRVSPHQPENLPVEVVEFGLEDLDESPGLA